MKKIGLIILAAFLGLIAYLLFWPVKIAPVAWEAPINRGYTGAFAPNTDLANLERLSIGDAHGPEDIAIRDNIAYVSSQEGAILRIDLASKDVGEFARTSGVPLGLEFDADGHLIVADAYRGLLSIAPNGEVTTLTNSVNNTPIKYADDVDIADDGVIYVSDASTKFGAEEVQSTMAASLLEIMEHGQTGRVLAYNPADQTTRIVADGYSFANGIAVHTDGDVLVVETGKYRVLKVDPVTGKQSVFIDNLPGFPDNINRGSRRRKRQRHLHSGPDQRSL
ncbi:SMP-30/gluconolactonase/LRE family protein [Litorimonas sp. RW-G-Af-16]|uniref:SMP-30/gluconolactonase/LRE family protein n=1 Tax=Litorimonas sp. RW-G-Af-16 TaxID=3241168 RepID=UPI003AAC8705